MAEGIVRTARRARWTAVDLLSLELGGFAANFSGRKTASELVLEA